MTTIYVASLLFGGVLLAVSLFGGHDGDGDLDAGGHDADASQPEHGAEPGPLAAFLTMRFWSFAAAFFGLTGLVLHGLGLVPPFVALGLAIVVGVGTGFVAARVLASITRDTVGGIGTIADHVGREARVLLPIARGRRGKVTVSLASERIDLHAETDDERPMEPGERVLVIAVRGDVAVVVRDTTPAS